MQEPKFSVGQDVAVCGHRTRKDGSEEWMVVPATTITRVGRYRAGDDYVCASGKINVSHRYSGWVYEVEALDESVRETSLRPINPDTEYQETEQEQEA